jgi:PAS domain S-box-containing protein
VASSSQGTRAGDRDFVDEPSLARALQVTLYGALGCALVIALFTALLGWPIVPLLALAAAGSVAAALWMGRSGRRRSGILLVVAVITFAVMVAATRNDGIQNVGLAVLPVVIVASSLLLDRLTIIFVTATAILSAMTMLALRYYVFRTETSSDADVGDFLIFAITCVCAALIGRLLCERILQGFRQLRESERRYRHIFENIQDVYYEMSPDGILLELSPAAIELFGIETEQLLRRSLASFCEERSEFRELQAALAESGRVSNWELAIRNCRGALVHVLVNARLQTGIDPGQRTVVGSLRDITEWRRAEAALRESEARLRLANEAAEIGTFDYYPQSGKLIWSDITRGHFGMSQGAEVDYEKFLDSIHPDDRERVRQLALSVALPDSDSRLAADCRVTGEEDGQERWISIRGRMLFDPQGWPIRLIGVTRDITRRKRLEEELRRRAEELHTIMDVAPVGLFTAHDPECRCVTVNRMGNALLELPDGSPVPASFEPPCPFFRDGEQIPVADLPLQAAARGIEVRDFEAEAVLPSGRRRLLWGHASPLRDAAGRVRGAICAAQDITESRRRANALLRESEERFREAADAAPVLMWLTDPKKGVTFVNEPTVRFTGLSAGELSGDGWEKVIHPEDLEAVRAAYLDGMKNHSSYQVEYRARRADGEYRHMLCSVRPRYVASEYAGHIGSLVDITDLKLRQEQDLARRKMESIGMLASGIAHDFNNLLGSILAQTELAETVLSGGARPYKELAHIGNVATRGSEIVRQLMIYAGIESEQSGAVDVSATVREMVELLRVSTSKHAVLQTDLGDRLTARADAAQIRQIVLNLVTNASEALRERDGIIQVSVHRLVAGRGLPGDSVQLQVSDTGCGLSPEAEARIFDPFFSTKSAGRGLGLAVVQGIVRSLNGMIHVESRPGHGATFRVLLPWAETPLPDAAPTTAIDQAAAQPAAILLVEDEVFLRQAVATMLRRKGHTVIEAGDGTTALETIRARPSAIDVVLLDITIPGASSREVFAEAIRLAPAIRIIATSAYSESEAAATLGGRPYFIRKPYRLAELLELVRKALASPQLEGAANP